MTLSSVTQTVMTAMGKGYTVHGTLDATLPALMGTQATGTVTLHASF